MNLQHGAQPRSFSNGFSRRRADKEIGAKAEGKMHSGKPASSNLVNAVNGGKAVGIANPSRDRLTYVITSLLGLHVEVHVRNGSIISGIFHATNNDKDFALLLKKTQVIKDGSVKGQKSLPKTVKKPVDMIIPAKDLVQIVAKDVSLDVEESSFWNANEKRKDLMIDSAISHSYHIEPERELERWTPDADYPECPEVEDIFDGTWNRNWDQFETNEALFGVKSTFDEELYTTKLERGPQMRELEREATRIAREIEGEDTRDLHLAEERGIQFGEDFDLDEEIKYSAVKREIDDHTFDGSQNSFLDAHSTESFVGSGGSAIPRSYSRNKFINEAHASSTYSPLEVEPYTQIDSDKNTHHSSSKDHGMPLADHVSNKSLSFSDKNRLGEKQIKKEDKEKNIVNECKERNASEKAQPSQSEDKHSSTDSKGYSSSVTFDTSSAGQDSKPSTEELSEVATSADYEPVNPSLHPGPSASSSLDRITAGSVSSGPGLSPSSSVGSVSSEKSTLNPNAKEFKLNPNAKSFTPLASFRPPAPAPISDGSFYYPSNLSAVPPMRNVPMGIGVGPSFVGHQPVFNSQSGHLQSPQAYIHPNGPMYGQQVIIGQPRPVYYMQAYPHDMPYKGRNF